MYLNQAKSPAHGISLFLVEEGMPGFKKGKKLKKLGLKAQDTSELFFDDLRVPSSAVLGKAGREVKGKRGWWRRVAMIGKVEGRG